MSESGTFRSTVRPLLCPGRGQRIRLATQIGSKLRGFYTFWMNPPSVFIRATTGGFSIPLADLRDMGNTVLVVEHDEETMRKAITSSTWDREEAVWAAISLLRARYRTS